MTKVIPEIVLDELMPISVAGPKLDKDITLTLDFFPLALRFNRLVYESSHSFLVQPSLYTIPSSGNLASFFPFTDFGDFTKERILHTREQVKCHF